MKILRLSMLKQLFGKRKEEGRKRKSEEEAGRAEVSSKEGSSPHFRGSFLASVSRSLCVLGNDDAFWKMSVQLRDLFWERCLHIFRGPNGPTVPACSPGAHYLAAPSPCGELRAGEASGCGPKSKVWVRGWEFEPQLRGGGQAFSPLEPLSSICPPPRLPGWLDEFSHLYTHQNPLKGLFKQASGLRPQHF